MAQSMTLLGCGDVGPIHGPIEHYGSLVRDALLAPDIRFDGAFIARVWRLPTRRAPQNQSPINDIRGRAVLGRGFDRGREPSAELTVESGHHEYRSVDA